MDNNGIIGAYWRDDEKYLKNSKLIHLIFYKNKLEIYVWN